MISPFFKTNIFFALCIVESLCAITIEVLFFVKLVIAFCTISSESESREEVASSKRIIGAFFNMALAIDILCFCPPESLIPFSPISVSYPLGRFSINSSAAADLHASFSSC